MLRFFRHLFDVRGFAPHGYCLLWQPELIWTHVIADAVTALAYATIPIALVVLVRKRGDIVFSWIFFCFAAFILACGATHVVSIVTLWQPVYGFQALVKALTASVSVATAGALWPLMPKLLAIPSPTQLRLANEALAVRVAERDAAIVQLEAEIRERQNAEARLEAQGRELELARSAAESASEAKSRFLAHMSHELRTPLNAVMGYAQLLMHEKDLSGRNVEAAQTIHDSGAHLLTLINDILDLSKIEAGKFELYPATMDLRGVLGGIAAIMRIRSEEKALEFHSDLAANLPAFVLADEMRLRQILLNLVSNAVKFTDRGSVVLCVSPLVTSEYTARINFSVRDTGVGIEADQLPAIFRPFEQVGAADRRAGGTGLGLSITRQLIEMMGGELRVESEPGEGSMFWFDLDLPISHTCAPSAEPIALCKGYEGDRRRILVVDDATANREVLAAILERLGFIVERAADARAGIDQALAAPPDLIMMDIRMPGMDGLEAINVLRRHAILDDVPIIAVSSSISTRTQSMAIAAGACSFLPKPLDQSEMVKLVGQAIDVEWIFDQPSADEVEVAMVLPRHEHLTALHEVALAGNMRAVRAEAKLLASLDPAYRPFAEAVTGLARTFQSQALLAMIERSMDADR